MVKLYRLIFLGVIASFSIPVFEVTQEIVIKLENKI